MFFFFFFKLQHQLNMLAVCCIEQNKLSAVCSPGCQPLNQSDAEWFFYACVHSAMHLICRHAYMSRCAWVYVGVCFEGPEQCVWKSLSMLLFFSHFFLMEQQYCICTSCSVLINLISELVLNSQSLVSMLFLITHGRQQLLHTPTPSPIVYRILFKSFISYFCVIRY